MAKRSTTSKPSSPRSTRPLARPTTTSSMATRLLSHPLAKELIAASLIYAAATIIRGQSKSGSLSRRLMEDPGEATGKMRSAAADITGGLGGMIKEARQAIYPALDSLMQHFGRSEEISVESGRRRQMQSRSAPSRSRAARNVRSSAPTRSRPRPPIEPTGNTLHTP
jgi:hypothetical protein